MNELIEKVSPHNVRAEQLTLGAMILSKSSIISAMSTLKKDDFYVPSHQDIFESIKVVHFKNLPVDIVTLMEYLEKSNMLETVGGMDYLVELSESIVTLETNSYYFNIVLENSQRRELIKVCKETISNCYMQPDFNIVLDNAEKKVLAIGAKRFNKGLIEIKGLVKVQYELTERIKNGEKVDLIPCVYSNITALDSIMKPQRTDLIVIGGRPGMGKSSILLEIARSTAKNSKLPVIIFSPEMSKEQVVSKILTLESGVSSYRLESGFTTDTQWLSYVDACSLFMYKDIPIYIDDSTNITPNEMRSKIRSIMQQHKELGCIVTDFLQKLKPNQQLRSKAEEISDIALECKNIAKEFNVPHYLGSQLSRKVEERQDKRPLMSDLKESGGIEENANKIVLLYRDSFYNKDTNDSLVAEIDLAKHREGPTQKIKMHFDAETTKFSSLEIIKKEND